MASQAPSEPSIRHGKFGAAVVLGFATAVSMWCLWLVAHHPAVAFPAAINGPLLLACLIAGTVCAGRFSGGAPPWMAGMGAGLIASLLNILILNMFLVRPTPDGTPAPGFEGLTPSAAVAIAGFFALGAVVGLIGGAIGGRLGISPQVDPSRWLARFAVVAALAVVPLLLLGGAVTSTSSGMAVRGWPDSYGANMFLYPIALMGHPRVFLEHSHRLFGALVGLTTITMALWTVLQQSSAQVRRAVALIALVTGVAVLGLLARKVLLYHTEWGFSAALIGIAACAGAVMHLDRPGTVLVKVWALGALAMVIVQGYLGGQRVNQISPYFGALHGVVAQIFLAMMVALAAYLSPLYRTMTPAAQDGDRRRKLFSTALLHSTIVQLIFGALYRHVGQEKGSMHSLWAHIGFSLVVVIAALMAGFALRSRKGQDMVDSFLRRLGTLILVVVSVQFVLGWATFLFVMRSGPRGPAPQSHELAAAPQPDAISALIATLHQGNGALLLTLAALAVVFTRQVLRAAAPAAPARAD